MKKKGTSKDTEAQFAYYMDLLGHDILNNNQAVLGYLELILASEGVDRRLRRYAEKAVSHVRTSTILIDNVKRLLALRRSVPMDLKPVDLMGTISRAERELSRIFPDKQITLQIRLASGSVFVVGNSAADDLMLNLFVSMARLDPGESIRMDLSLSEVDFKDQRCWKLVLEDAAAEMPEAARDKPLEAAYTQDSSTAVKMVGMLFCKMMSVGLGGDFEVKELNPGHRPPGAVFVTFLRKADGP